MEELPTPVVVAAAGLLGGAVLGFTARYTRFCTYGAIEDAQLGGDWRRMRAWVLAVVVALGATQGLDAAGIIDIDLSVHLRPQFTWLSLIAGGLIFGYGMAMTGTCALGTLVRAGGGDLRGVVAALVVGVSGYMAMRGLTGMLRFYGLDPVMIAFAERGDQGIDALLGLWTGAGRPFMQALLSGLIVAAGLWWCFRDGAFRKARRHWIGGIVFGAVIAYGWCVSALLGADEFDPQPFVSYGFVRPSGEALVYLMTYTGASVNFGIGAVGGVLIGACLAAVMRGEWRPDAFDGVREMRRHLIGAFLMGFGGITMLGCTVGQGITGLSTLSAGSLLAVAAMIAGSLFGTRVTIEGSFRAAVFGPRLTA